MRNKQDDFIANKTKLNLEDTGAMSLIYIINSKGSNINHFGISHIIAENLEITSLTDTICML